MLPNGWREGKLGELGQAIIGLTYKPENVVDSKNGLLVLRSSNVQNGEIAFEDNVYVDMDVPVKLIVKDGDILICVRNGSRNLIGKCALIDKSSAGNTFGAFMAIFRAQNPKFVFQLLQTEQYKREIHRNLGATINQITNSSLNSFSFLIPPEEEQEKIVEFLSTWDNAVSQLREQINVKQKQKKALMRRLLTGKHRFPEFIRSSDFTKTKYGDIPADWEYVHINHVASHVSTKNKDGRELPVLSCTKHHGLVNSADYFDKQVHSKDLSTYKIIKKGQFAYATNHIEEGSIGYQNLHDEAVISPMYTIFKTNNKIDDSYLFKLVKTDLYRHIFGANTNASVDRRGSLRWPDFSKLYIPLPSIPEQQKIAAFLDIADQEIKQLTQKLEAYQEQKKGLMQQLLTGKKRVKIDHKEAA